MKGNNKPSRSWWWMTTTAIHLKLIHSDDYQVLSEADNGRIAIALCANPETTWFCSASTCGN